MEGFGIRVQWLSAESEWIDKPVSGAHVRLTAYFNGVEVYSETLGWFDPERFVGPAKELQELLDSREKLEQAGVLTTL